MHIEAFHPVDKKWVKVGEVPPAKQGSLSDNKPDGKRDVYVFKCEGDNSKSTIYRSVMGIDTEEEPFRIIENLSGFKVVKELNKGESFEFDIKTDKSPVSRKIRFTHR